MDDVDFTRGMNQAGWIDIEKALNKVVPTLGGMRVEDYLGKKPAFKNADYVFPSVPYVAELKCLTKDQMKDFPGEMNSLINQWIRAGIVPPVQGRAVVETKNLPMECQLQVVKLYREPIRNVIRKANAQLRETKQHLGMPDAPGVLLLANDGNTLLELGMALYVLGSTLAPEDSETRKYRSVQRFVYFTANMPSIVKGESRDAMVWVSSIELDGQDDMSPHLSQLQGAWFNHYESLVGQQVPVHQRGGDDVRDVKIRRPWDQ